MSEAPVERTAAWLGEAARPFLAWFHACGAAAAPRVAVICPPIGHEYTITHRTLRHLADRLARAGIPAMRFDYDGTGDSAGDDHDPDRVAAWGRTIAAAIGAARAWQRDAEVVLIGLRLGGTLAAHVAQHLPVDSLVLWNPCVAGRNALRELQALAMAGEQAPGGDGGELECAGYTYTEGTRAALGALDMRRIVPRARRVLLAWRDDAPGDARLASTWSAHGIAVESVTLPGWAAMMTEHQFSQVPGPALEGIVSWVRWGGSTPEARPVACADPASLRHPTDELCRFGPGQRLFGILTRPARDEGKPAVVLFNAGSVHRVGPNRVGVEIARALAANGHPVLRFDHEGLGDSVLAGEGRENHPYPPTATRDAHEALAYLRKSHGFRRFVAMGLCSGAHTTFHAALEGLDPGVEALVMINPFTLHYVEGMSLAEAGRQLDAQAYKRSARDPRRWLKLLRGEVDLRRLAEVATAWPRDAARARWSAFCEAWWPSRAPQLARDLAAVLEEPRSVALFLAQGDPGPELLLAGAPRTAARAIASGRIHHAMIPGADHTFTRRGPRRILLEKLVAHLASLPATVNARAAGRMRLACNSVLPSIRPSSSRPSASTASRG